MPGRIETQRLQVFADTFAKQTTKTDGEGWSAHCHRLGSIRDADQVLVFEEGSLALGGWLTGWLSPGSPPRR
ncbi:hypothetical protein [Rahnella inusitata]|uniref:hypothetical protein n=1 Tax=Rahnella inusitata TaxID=58169 RepID=UPI0039B03CE8